MIAYKGFNKDLACTMGKGKFQYEIGKTYQEDAAKCANIGFHCVEEPIGVLTWYSSNDSRYCIVDAGGDINEDGDGRISCTELTVIKEITLQQLGALECSWLMEHPERKYSKHVLKDKGTAKRGRLVIVRGKNPKAKGEIGATIYLLKEAKKSKTIKGIGIFEIDGKEYLPDVFYGYDGRAY